MPPKRGKGKDKASVNSAGSSVPQQGLHRKLDGQAPAGSTRSKSRLQQLQGEAGGEDPAKSGPSKGRKGKQDELSGKGPATPATLKRRKRNYDELSGEDPAPLDALEPAGSVMTPGTTTTKRTNTKFGPKSVDFRETVLEPRGITINSDTQSLLDSYFHFASNRTAETKYKELEGLENLNIWLETDSDFLRETAAQYDCMTADGMCEAEFATFGKERLLKGEPRIRELPEDRKYRPERMIELVAKPGVKWIVPPILFPDLPARLYSFDIRPDCVYWLSLQAFNPDWRSRIREYALVMYRRVTCPYFTIEFKRDDSTPVAAENQVAVAGVMALYNRYLLRSKHLQLAKKKKQVSDITCLKHYGATFSGCDYSLWCIEPKLAEDGTWDGCTMSRIFQGYCDTKEGLKSCVRWLNEIHAWGLTEYGPALQRDLKGCMQALGLRLSDIGMVEDDEGVEDVEDAPQDISHQTAGNE